VSEHSVKISEFALCLWNFVIRIIPLHPRTSKFPLACTVYSVCASLVSFSVSVAFETIMAVCINLSITANFGAYARHITLLLLRL